MKRLDLTDAELQAVRLAVAQLAGSAPEGVNLRTALVKLDRAASGAGLTLVPDALRRVEIVTIEPVGSRNVEHVVHCGLTSRWTAKHAAIAKAAKWRVSMAGRVAVRIDDNEVDVAALGENEALS